MKKFLLASSALLGFLAIPAAANAVTISNAATGNSISPFGTPDTLTYGQVFTAPVTGTLVSFALYLDGTVGDLFGGVGTWNGTPAHGFGFGSPTNLYQSADTASVAGANSFSPNIAVVAGQQYVAYLSVFGVAGASGTTSMQLGDNSDPNINYFVWNNSSDARGNSSWNYFFDTGDALFSAEFRAGAIPEPTTWAMMIAGFGAVGFAMRRRRNVAVSFA